MVLGLIAGYFGRHIDSAVMRLIDMMLAFRSILLALTIVSFLGSGLFNVMIAVGISGIPNFARLVRGFVLSAKENLYVEAARCVGCGDRKIIFRHILPNVVAPVIILATLAYGWAILNAASLSFLGLGAQPPTSEWGIMLSDGRGYLREAPWITIFPGMAIMISVLSANILGDGLRDALDPHQRMSCLQGSGLGSDYGPRVL
jgi:peptide/nickel transport system permease protein